MFFNREVKFIILKYNYVMNNIKEDYYIDPPTKILMKNLIWIWITFFVTFLLSVNGLQSFFLFLWVPLIVLLYLYSNLWTKFGFSLIIYWAMNIIAYLGGYLVSRVIHFIIKLIINLIGGI